LNLKPDRAPYIDAVLGAASYILWFITAALGILDVLIIRRLLLEIALVLDVNPWAYGAVDKFGLLILGIGWIILTYGAEAYFRRAAAISLHKLLRSFGLVTGTQILFGGLAMLVTLILI
jgi:hypothetical protein